MVKKMVALGILVLAIVAVGVAVKRFLDRPLEYVLTETYGQRMIDFELSDLSGEAVLVTGSSGKPKIVNFWTSWCGYCQDEVKHLNRIYEDYKQSIDIISVNVSLSDEREDALAFVDDYKVAFPVLFDEEGTVSAQYRITAIPTNYFIAGDGEIIAVTHEMTTANSKELLQRLLESASASSSASSTADEAAELTFQLTASEHAAYESLKRSPDDSVLLQLEPISVAKLYVQASYDAEYGTAYRLYTTRPDRVAWSKEEDERIPEKDRGTRDQIAATYKHLEQGQFVEVGDDEGYIAYEKEPGVTSGFQLIKDASGSWKVAFMPVQ